MFAAAGLAAASVLVIGAPDAAEPAITPSPAFTPAELVQLPTTSWPTNGGNLYNQRYSPLTQLDRNTVKDLKAVWRASLSGSGLDPKASGQAQMLEWQGVLYVVTGMDDVFAISVDTGKVLWTYQANLDPAQVNVCCGWDARGLGMGDGRIYVGQLDNQVVALDQTTGKVAWRTQSQTSADGGYSITMAPLYYDGMVIIGHSGGERGIRGVIKAFDAATGKLRWLWHTVPAPGEPGSETWPKNSDVWKYGGGAVWSTPAVDPELGLIYFPVANPAPDLNGHVRAGNNLFTSSIVALDVKTGKYRWHYQAIHHDIWDYGGANPVILFDVMVNGQLRKALSHAPKSGYVYILDRITGKPLIGIEERPVPQDASQKTSPTQPVPIGDDVVPHSMDAAPEGYQLVNQGRTFTPFEEKPVVYKQLAGINWPPMSYDRDEHVLYVCANDTIGVLSRGGEDFVPPGVGKSYTGGSFGRTTMPRIGLVAALDVTTQKLKWRLQWPDVCVSGSVNTAGGLLFMARTDGRVMALDKHDGSTLWQWQLDAPISAPITTFEYRGEQMVAVYAAGNYYSGARRGDGVWLLSRKGTMPPMASFADATPLNQEFLAADAAGGNAAAGRQIFQRTCEPCHGESGKGGHAEGAILPDNVAAATVMNTVTTGKKDMPSFKATMSPQDLKDVAAYVEQLLKK